MLSVIVYHEHSDHWSSSRVQSMACESCWLSDSFLHYYKNSISLNQKLQSYFSSSYNTSLVYLFIFIFNYTISSLDYIVSNDRMVIYSFLFCSSLNDALNISGDTVLKYRII